MKRNNNQTTNRISVVFLLLFVILLHACSVKHLSPNSKGLFEIGSEQYKYIDEHYYILNSSHYVLRLKELEAILCNGLNNCPALRYYIIAADTPAVFTSVDGRVFLADSLLDNESNFFCSDDEIAAILAHEIAHLEYCHLLQHIEHQKEIRFFEIEIEKPSATGAVWTATSLFAGTVFRWNKKEWSGMNTVLYESTRNKDDKPQIIMKIAKEVTLYSNYGFNIENELEADNRAIEILKNAGFSPIALRNILHKQLKFINNNESFPLKEIYINNLNTRSNNILDK